MYLGGGTPSLLAADAIRAIVDHVAARFGLASDAEVTLEANPGPTERGDVPTMASTGINRLSIGAQSLEATTLTRLGRRHSPADVAATVAAARGAGIRSVSIDLLYDVPGQTERAWADDLERALALEPDHLSLYALSLEDADDEGGDVDRSEPGAQPAERGGDRLPVRPGARRWRTRARRGQDDDRAAAMYEHTVRRLAAAGYRGYEISNWARPGHESRHNQRYWERQSVEAVGPGAHAFDGVTRRWNAASLDGYLAALQPGERSGRVSVALPPGGSEQLTPVDAAAERRILGLRLDRGLDRSEIEDESGAEAVAWALATGLLAQRADRLVLTTRGRLLSNELFARLL